MPVPRQAQAVLAVGAGLVLVAGGWQVLSGSLAVGALVVATSYLRQLYSPVRSLTRLSAVLAKASASAGRIAAVLDCDLAVADNPGATTAPPIGRVEWRDVSFAYEPGRPVLRRFDLRLAPGELVCLIGPSGAGKSTVLNLLLRLYDADEGQVLVDGRDVRTMSLRSLRERIAFVPQDAWLLDGTVAANIAFGSRRATRAEVLDAGRAPRRRVRRPAPAGLGHAAGRGRGAVVGRRIADRVVDIRDPRPEPVPFLDERPTRTLEGR